MIPWATSTDIPPWMELQGASDAIMWRAFPLTFENRAMRWFKKLPHRSIRSWNDLSGQFVSTFMGARTRSTPKERLISIKQGRTETLRSYMDRFSKRIVEVDKISDDAALMAVLSRLRTRTRFWWSVHEDGPATYQEFLARAEKHIGAEEATSDQENDRPDRKDGMKSKEKDLKAEKKESPKKALDFQHPGRPRPTPPRVPRIPYPKHLARERPNENQRQGHPQKARSYEGKLIRAEPTERSRRQRRKLSREAHNSYQVLDGYYGLTSTRRSSLFSEEDASHVLQPHSDALVITMPVSDINIHRTIVDDGSSVNILYLRTFEQMGINARHVRSFPKPLQGFTGDCVNPKGQIALVVDLGLPPCHGRIIADFVMVDLPSNYNAILGRPILHELKAAASIYHYAIKFPTPHGVGIVRGKSASSKELQRQLPPSRGKHSPSR
ncbi:Retrotrans gag domain-containing protein [Abeliophyllum distichum]|uniref:Retrotrans gag domain-containing protein n=1 Tax=Abeliophyllum distichum TaxID=126358 RepID=A0ABD1UHW2_9LAMI